ncbi:hypothetical protein BDV29DRAFT_163015 [Aspergillus leporis]|uniref:Uncharacterized protein n=1 Tax=Aspergillus leporis TaxID=41062 RepID=A0A5N5WKF2_9EURO|nr:hypothetical protein BDV29DRAFT_163015 [Aspergillus leporis]
MVFQHIHIGFSRASFRRVQGLCQSAYVQHVRRFTYAVPFLQNRDLARGYDSAYAPFSVTSHPFLMTLEEQNEALEIDQQTLCDVVRRCPNLASIDVTFLPPAPGPFMKYRYAESTQRHMLAILSVLAASRRKPVHIQQVHIDLFHCLQSPDELGLRHCLEEGLAEVTDLKLRGQYRFWDTVLELDIFTHVALFTLSDSTVVYETLESMLRHRGHKVQQVTLDRVGLLPYPQLGYLSQSGTRQQIVSWLPTMRTRALQLLEIGGDPPLAGPTVDL